MIRVMFGKSILITLFGVVYGVLLALIFRVALIRYSEIEIAVHSAILTGIFWGVLFGVLNAVLVDSLGIANHGNRVDINKRLGIIFVVNFVVLFLLSMFGFLPLPHVDYTLLLASSVSMGAVIIDWYVFNHFT